MPSTIKLKQQRLKAEIEKAHGRLEYSWPNDESPVYDAPLIKGTCVKCGRVFYWRVVPKDCPWPTCDGKLRVV